MEKQKGQITVETKDGNTLTFNIEIREPTTREKLTDSAMLTVSILETIGKIPSQVSPTIKEILTDIGNLNKASKRGVSPQHIEQLLCEIMDKVKVVYDEVSKLTDFQVEQFLNLVGIMDGLEEKERLEKIIKSQINP